MRASAIRQLAAAQSAARLAAAFVERTVQVWDLCSFERVSQFDTVYEFGGHRITLSPTGEACVAAARQMGRNGGVACYDAVDGSLLWHRTDIGHTQFLRFSCGGKTIWCGVEDGRLQCLDAGSGTTVDTLAGIKRVLDSPHSNLLLLETRSRGFLIKSRSQLRIPNLTFALLDAAFSPDCLCLSEAGGPVRCLEPDSGAELWRYEPPKNAHVLRLGYRPADQRFYGVQWEYEHGTSRVLLRFSGEGAHEAIRQLRSEILERPSWDEQFGIDGDVLVTSTGEVISVLDGSVMNRLAFPETEYPDSPIAV